jgi:hypothetical protein
MAKKASRGAGPRGGGTNFNKVKSGLQDSARNLENALNEEGDALSPTMRRHYEKALISMNIAYFLIKKVECTGTHMTFEFRVPKRRVRRAPRRPR